MDCSPPGAAYHVITHHIGELDARLRDSLAAFAVQLHPEDVRMRFGTPVRAYEGGHLLRTLGRSGAGQAAIWAVGNDGALVGIANCADLGSGDMEVALIVRSDRKRLGIGTALLEESRRRAEAARCRALWGMILWENVSMRCLAARMGFRAAGVSGLAMQVRLVLSGG